MKIAVVALVIGAWLAAADTQRFTGIISDDQCATADHSRMQMGADDAECTRECIRAHGAAYVLYDGSKAYKLSGTQTLDPFAGQRVNVAGTLDVKTHTIRVDAITRAE